MGVFMICILKFEWKANTNHLHCIRKPTDRANLQQQIKDREKFPIHCKWQLNKDAGFWLPMDFVSTILDQHKHRKYWIHLHEKVVPSSE